MSSSEAVAFGAPKPMRGDVCDDGEGIGGGGSKGSPLGMPGGASNTVFSVSSSCGGGWKTVSSAGTWNGS
jgi:hypothetical protein